MERIKRIGSSRIATRSREPWSKRGNLGARAALVLVVKEHHCGVIVIIAFWWEISREIFGRGTLAVLALATVLKTCRVSRNRG